MQTQVKARDQMAPLVNEAPSPPTAPTILVGLLTKLNLLAIGLILATAIGVGALLFSKETKDLQARMTAQGTTIASMLSRLSESSLSSNTADASALHQLLETLGANRDIAYVTILNADRKGIASRSFSDVAMPETPDYNFDEHVIQSTTISINGHRYLDVMTPIVASSLPTAETKNPMGWLRLGMSLETRQDQLRNNLSGAFSVVAVLVLLAILLTLLLTRRLVAPIRELTRAAHAVAAGKLDVRVATTSNDELGLLTHTFNHMTQRLSESQAEVANYQRTLEDKVTQRTKELEVATAQAYKLAQHDILTGLPNRALLNQRLKQIIAQAARDHYQVACLFLDFDHFKRINDTLGHDAGDRLLQSVAQRLTNAVRESDTVARLGGDEFVVILPALDATKSTVEIMAVLTRIRESFQAPFRLGDQTPTLTCSIGVSVYPIDADDPGSLIKQADTAMYAVKDSGRNAYRFYTADMNARVQARLQIETDMRRALMDDEFFLVYQPQIEMASGRACGVEALLRWRDPERGIIGPNEFIPIAEESGMIQALGARVLRDACRQAVIWHRENMMLRVSVNLSVQQLQHDSWLSIVEDALRVSGLPARYLDLEITESVIITHSDKAVATLMDLKRMGVSITVDDFGTGYSSLSYLTRLPIQGVKIDQRFVRGLEQNPSDAAISQAIIALSHSLGLRVIAEGVETAAQFTFLKAHGCEEAQGYLISHPLEEADLRAWWMMQDDENRIIGRQGDMWRQESR